MLLVRNGTVRTLRGEIYVCSETSLAVLEADRISYEKAELPFSLKEVDARKNAATSGN